MPVENVGMQDYVAVAPQTQSIPQEEISMPPMVYDEELETKKKASSNMLGYTILGAIAAAGVIYGFVQHGKVKTANLKIEELGQKLDTAKKAVDKERSFNARERFVRFFKKNAYLNEDEIKQAEIARKARAEAEKANKKPWKERLKFWNWFKSDKSDKANKASKK